jgi:hypothetical protein
LWNTNGSISFWWYNGTATTGATELYDGTSWTTSPASMATAKTKISGAGTQSIALTFGKAPPYAGATEEWTGAGSPTTVTITAS